MEEKEIKSTEPSDGKAEERVTEAVKEKKLKDPGVIAKKLTALWSDKRSYWKRLGISALVMAALAYTFIFFGPLEMVAFSGKSFTFSYKDVAGYLAVLAVSVFALVTPVISILRGRIYNYIITALFGVTVCGYLQAAIFNGKMGTLTGDAVDWSASSGDALINVFAWIAIILVILFVLYLKRKVWTGLVTVVSIALIVMQAAPTVAIFAGAYKSTNKGAISEYYLTQEDMFDYSEGKNVFVFVLDRLDYDYIERMMANDPDCFDWMDGFTQYTNAISSYARTKPALNQLMTASDGMAYNMPTANFYKDSWTFNGKDVLGDIDGAGYTIDFYTKIDYLFSDAEYVSKYVDNATNGKLGLKPAQTVKKLMELSAYRYSPLCLKPFFWGDTNYFNNGIHELDTEKLYEFDDAAYKPGFETATATEKQNSFKFYHLYGPHAPYTLTEAGTRSETNTDVLAQTRGSFRILKDAFQQMKDLGVYDDATIIITGDHGSAVNDYKPLLKATKIGIFYKPSGSSGVELKKSSAQVCTANILPTLMKAVGVNDPAVYGRALDEIGEDEEIDRYYFKSVMGSESRKEDSFVTYLVKGEAGYFDNWTILEENPVIGNFY